MAKSKNLRESVGRHIGEDETLDAVFMAESGPSSWLIVFGPLGKLLYLASSRNRIVATTEEIVRVFGSSKFNSHEPTKLVASGVRTSTSISVQAASLGRDRITVLGHPLSVGRKWQHELAKTRLRTGAASPSASVRNTVDQSAFDASRKTAARNALAVAVGVVALFTGLIGLIAASGSAGSSTPSASGSSSSGSASDAPPVVLTMSDEHNAAVFFDAHVMINYAHAPKENLPQIQTALIGKCAGRAWDQSTSLGGTTIGIIAASDDSLCPQILELSQAYSMRGLTTAVEDASSWEEMLDIRFSRTVSWSDADDFARQADLVCAEGQYDEGSYGAGNSRSVEAELRAIVRFDDCALTSNP